MAKIMRYTLDDFNQIIFNGFDYKLPNETMELISNLASQVGSPSYVKTPVFQKRANPLISASTTMDQSFAYKKKKGNKHLEIINDTDWETVRTPFHATKIEEKVGLDAKIDVIRSYLNKFTDKNYNDIKAKINTVIQEIISENVNEEDMLQIGEIIFGIASTNRFYSKIYADLYTDLINNYEIMNQVFEHSFNAFLKMFDNIEYVEPSVDYAKFCKINNDNEKRKALSSFFVNLMINGIITKERIVDLLKNLLLQFNEYINIENKKNEVDEITENIAILYKKNILEECEDFEDVEIDGISIPDFVKKIANSKSKNYLSLTNKSIFKFMDLIEM